jgi:hypothetical protein
MHLYYKVLQIWIFIKDFGAIGQVSSMMNDTLSFEKCRSDYLEMLHI